jgi:cation diffusion facilitator family transporter
MVHDHTHGVPDDTLLSTDKGIRALKVSLLGLLATAAFQAGIAIVGGSAALLADTIHNLADAFTTVPLWIAFVLARRQATRRFTYGYGRAEDVAGAVILLFILFSAGVSGYESYVKLVRGEPITLLGLGMLAGLVGVVGNEAVARYKIRVGNEIGSASLVADGQHSRVDGLTSLAAFLGLLGVFLGRQFDIPGLALADPIAGFVITLAILWILVDVGADVVGRLMDAIDPAIVEEMERIATSVEGVSSVHNLRARWLGHNITMEIHICVAGGQTLAEAHALGEKVRHELLHHIPRLSDVIVHADPQDETEGCRGGETM